MEIYNHTYEIMIKEEFTNITNKINSHIKEHNVQAGVVLIYTKHTTSTIKTLEDELLLKTDMHNFLEDTASENKKYCHDMLELRDVPANEPENGFSHLRALFISNRELIPIIDGKMDLGTYQEIFYVELNPGHTNRSYSISIMEI